MRWKDLVFYVPVVLSHCVSICPFSSQLTTNLLVVNLRLLYNPISYWFIC